MFGLTPLGVVHTLISLVSLVSGFWLLARDWQISPLVPLGKVYLVTTFIGAATGLGIYQHGGFGPPHVLSIMTILAVALGTLLAVKKLFGRLNVYLQSVCLTSTMLFHLIPGFTESLTRLPLGAPVLASPEAPEFKLIYGVLLVVFAAGLMLQIRWLKAGARR